MLTNNLIKGLSYIIDVSNDKNLNSSIIFEEEMDSETIAELINYAFQLIDVNSDKFTIITSALNVQSYCDIELLIEIYKLYQSQMVINANTELLDNVLNLINTKNIPDEKFKKAITEMYILYILNKNLIQNYKNVVSEGLEVIRSIPNKVVLFSR